MPRVVPVVSMTSKTGADSSLASAALLSAPPVSSPSYSPLLPSIRLMSAPLRLAAKVERISSCDWVKKSRLKHGLPEARASHSRVALALQGAAQLGAADSHLLEHLGG